MNKRFLLPLVTAACATFAAPALAAAPATAPATETYQVEGMVCQGCAQTVTDRLKAVPGVRDVKVNLKARSATVSYARDRVAYRKLSSARAGTYKLKPAAKAPASH